MRLEKWALISEIVGGFAIVVTLIVLAIQVGDNTAAIRAASILEVNKIARDHLITMWANADANRIDQIGQQNLAELAPDDRQRFVWSVRSFWLGMQTIYRQHELGTLPDEEWQVYYDVVCDNIALPGTRELWTETDLIPEFVEVVKSCPSFQ